MKTTTNQAASWGLAIQLNAPSSIRYKALSTEEPTTVDNMYD